MPDVAQRQQQLLDRVPVDAFISVNLEGSDPVSIRYLTGFTGEGALILSRTEVVLLTDSRYTEQAKQETEGLTIKETRGWTVKGLSDALVERNLVHVVFSATRASLQWYKDLQALGTLELSSEKDLVAQLRRTKTAEELGHLRRAAAVADQALEALLPQIKIGMTETEIALRLEVLIRESEAQGIAFDVNCSTGSNTALNHYDPSLSPSCIQAGDLLLFDFGAQVQGYRSDMTRTFAVGEPHDKALEIYDIVLTANCKGIDAIRAGVTGIEVDAVSRDHIRASGYGEYFGHGLGHGIGLEVHEPPGLSPLSKDTLEAGMVVTVEPGIYIPGFGGVRIEDDVVVTASGCEVITTFPKDRLMSVG